MAQVHLDEKKIALSEHTTVAVTDNAQIEFTVTPSQEFMTKTFVYLSSPAWVSLCNSARSKINTLLDEKKEESWMYHPNSKFACVKETGQVFLATYNRKGNMMKDHSVFLSNQEWVSLDDNIENINKMLDQVWSSKKRNGSAKGMMTTYRWKFNEVKGGKEHSGFVYYLDRQTCREAAMQYANNTIVQMGPVQIETFVQTPLDPLKLMTVVYYTMLYKAVRELIHIGDYDLASEYQVDLIRPSSPGPIPANKIKRFLKDNYDMVHEIITDDLVEEVFLECWKRMKMGITDAHGHLSSIHTVLSEKEIIAEKVNDTGRVLRSDPQCILINSVWTDMSINNKILKYFKEYCRNMTDNSIGDGSVTDVYPPPPAKKSDAEAKKMKMEIGSDTESSE